MTLLAKTYSSSAIHFAPVATDTALVLIIQQDQDVTPDEETLLITNLKHDPKDNQEARKIAKELDREKQP